MGLALLGIALVLAADTGNPKTRAIELINEARTAFAEGRFELAAQRYLEARALLEPLDVTGKDEILYNAGLSFDRAGRCDRAVEVYERLRAESAEARETKTFRAQLEQALACAPEVEIQSIPTGASAIVDGVARGATPLVMRLVHGTHRIHLELSGYAALSFSLDVEKGTRQRIERALTAEPGQPHRDVVLDVPPPPPPPPPIAIEQPIEPASPVIAPWIVGGSGAVAVGLGVIFAVLSASADRREAEEEMSVERKLSLRRDARAFAWARNISFGVGGAALVSAGVLGWIEATD